MTWHNPHFHHFHLLHSSATRDMTSGSIIKAVLLFSLPLMIGNLFQMLYNTVDVIVVGNYVGKEALAAVGSTTVIINMQVFFFNGFSVGAGVVIARYFGAKDMDGLHKAIETTMTATFLICVLFTAAGVAGVRPMLHAMSTPDDVMASATTYLRIYFAGISGLLIYNMGSGILRAVGNTTLPLLFLVLTSLLNVVLDLVFVIVLHAGVAGVAWATILSQFVSAGLILLMLSRSKEIYKLVWKDLHVDRKIMRSIFAVGLPAGIQSVITAFSNVFVQGYVNAFGSSAMAGWSCYNKLDQFLMLPMQSMSMASTTFVSQNVGAKKEERASRGMWTTLGLTLSVTGTLALLIFVFAEPAVRLFTADESVIHYGALFLHANIFFFLFNCVNHVVAGGLRGRGNSRGPMLIMLFCFVLVRQLYLFIMTRFISNTPMAVCVSYPVGWVLCATIITTYYVHWSRHYVGNRAQR